MVATPLGICSDSNCVAVDFKGGKPGTGMCCVKKRRHVNALMDTAEDGHQHLQHTPKLSGSAQASGFGPERDPELAEEQGVCSPGAAAAPSLAGWYGSGPTQNKTQYFSSQEKYTHGAASGGFRKFFKGKWKGRWVPLGSHLQLIVRTGSPGRDGDAWWSKALSHTPCGSSRSLYCTPKPAPGRTGTCLHLDLAPFQRLNRMQIKSSIAKSMANR